MNYLTTFEAFDIEKYREFAKKYKKTGYISKGSIKKLEEMGIKASEFQKMCGCISKYVKFLERTDFEA